MIHSLSGGVLCDVGVYTFVKVEYEEGPDAGSRFWYLAELPVKVGDRVLVPVGKRSLAAKVILIEVNSAQTAPYPLNRIRSVERVLP